MRHFLPDPGYDIYCTGRISTILPGDLATLICGRTIETEVFRLSFPGFLQFKNLKDTHENFEKYLIYEGMPYLIHLPLKDEMVLRNLFNTIVIKAGIERHQIRNVGFLRNLCDFIADHSGSLISGKRVSDYLKSQKILRSPAMVIEYFSFPCEAFYIFQEKHRDLQ